MYYYNLEKDNLYKSDWEKTRIQTYYFISAFSDKKSKLTYQKFTKNYWPFEWEKNSKPKQVNTDNIMSWEDWNAILSKPAVPVSNN